MNDEENIVTLLRCFFAAMRQWEVDCAIKYRKVKSDELDPDMAKEQCLAGLRSIFQQFCVTWEKPARTRYGSFHFGRPPEYDPEGEDVLKIEIAGAQATVFTQQRGGLKTRMVYRLSRLNGEWKIIDNRKRVTFESEETDWDL